MSNNFYNPAFFEYKEVSHRLLADDKGMPLTVYHGTEHRFERFQPLSHFGSIYAAQHRIRETSHVKQFGCSFIHSAGSIEKNLNKMVEAFFSFIEKPRKKHADDPICIPAHLALYRPKKMIELSFYRSEYKDDLMYQLVHEQLMFGFRFYHHLTTSHKKSMALNAIVSSLKIPPIYDFIFKDPFKRSDEQVIYELGLENLYSILGANDKNPYEKDLADCKIEHSFSKNQYINRLNLSMQRMIRYWESKGYDGFIYKNTVADNGAFSYVVFRPQQVIRLDRPAEYQISPIYPSVKNQEKLDKIQRDALAKMSYRQITNAEINRMTMWHLENKKCYEKF